MDKKARERTLAGLLCAIGALVLGLVAQDYFWRFLSAPTPTDGLLVMAAAIVLFGIALRRGKATRHPEVNCPAPQEVARSDQWEPWRVAGATLLLVLAGAATFASLGLFRADLQPQLRWLLYPGAIVTFLAALHVLPPQVRYPPLTRPAPKKDSNPTSTTGSRWHLVALVGILFVGAFFRLYRFTELPYGLWYDEADNGLWVREILSDASFRPIYVSSTNLPAHFLYLIALSFRLLGDSMYAIRAVSVVFGMLTVVAAYCCGFELGGGGASGRTFGLILAFLLAVSRWDVNWSRIGMHGVTVPFFELWAVASLLRGLRTRRHAAFGWAGVAMGLGLCFYSPFRVFPVVLAGFLLAFGIHWLYRESRRKGQQGLWQLVRRTISVWGVPTALYSLGILIAVAPVAQFALLNPDVFWDRAKRISILKDPQAAAHPVQALLDSASKHLLMFHYQGDPNGRHNLPGAPMLDRLTGVLMVFGVVVCFSCLKHPRSILLLSWLLIPLSGGVLSTWFEAPQSLRSIGSLPAAYALACLPMIWFGNEWRHVFDAYRKNLRGRSDVQAKQGETVNPRLAILAAVFLAAIGLENGLIYFYLWGRDFASWAAFSAAETRLAREVIKYRHSYELRFDPLLTAHLTTRYLVPDYQVYHHFDPATVFPLRGTAQGVDRPLKGVMLFVAPDTYSVRQQAEELYRCGDEPCAQIERFAHPYSGNVVMHEYLISEETITSVQGLDGRYVPLAESDVGKPERGEIVHRVVETIDFVWENDKDAPKAFPFQASWTGGLLAPQYGVYTLRVDLPGHFVLVLDGQEVLSGAGSASQEIMMAQGVHALYLEGQVDAPGTVRLAWRPPSDPDQPQQDSRTVPRSALYRASWPTRGLVGRFYANAGWSGEPEMVRLDRQLAYYFHYLPLSRPYTVEWSGRLAVPVEGVYRLSMKAISSASLHIDGQPVIADVDRPQGRSSGQIKEGEVYLAAGLHDIRVQYLDDQSHSQIYVYWQLPGADQDRPDRELIPPSALFPPAEGAWWPAP
jgi:4-amino-4-deoxy-L-arabinose transferase-like glycosyltransferase